MRSALNCLRPRPYRTAMAAGAIGLVLSACSQDSSRFQDDPFSNPFRSRSETTSSISNAPAGQVESQPLGGPSHQSLPSSYSSAPRSVPAAPAPTYMPLQASYDPGVTGGSSPRFNDSGWTADGGTAVTLQQGETIDTIARRYGVPASAIMRANNFADASYVRPGSRVVIPTYQGNIQRAASVQPVPAAPISQQRQQTYQPAPPPARAAASTPARSSRVHVVNAGDTLYSLGRRYNMSHADIARANGLGDNASLDIGQRVNIPGQGAVAVATPAAPVPAHTQFSPPPPAHKQASIEPAAGEPAQKVAAVSPVPQAEEQRSLGGSPQFRWPVRGRVISAYGAKSNGQHNDGINLAVPEGTDVKAAEDGVVAYSGNELKGYGNLVLLRHADGWMTAYAHNSQLLVKRGETIKRGQNIARAGQTGGVSSPQVHFEIRKGSTPVDPTQYLAGL
jgi:murein DD-endopeptidase MepM/ murein hydrolase activator NlpD